LLGFRPSAATRFILFVTLSIAACGGSDPGPDPGPGRIMFTRQGNGLQDLYAMDLKGTNLVQVTTSFAVDAWGSWSPDTLKILFGSDRIPDSSYTPRFQIYVMNSDGSNVSQLTFPDPARDSTGHVTDTTTNAFPAWSSDGAKIAFASTRDTTFAIYVMDPNGTNILRLTHDSANDTQPSWSPDDSKIAFATDRDGNAEIYAMNADGSNPVNLTNDLSSDRDLWRTPYFNYMAGFVTGANYVTYLVPGRNSHVPVGMPLAGHSRADDAVFALLEQYCDQNPGKNISEAAMRVYAQLSEQTN
jgi:TolB protein